MAFPPSAAAGANCRSIAAVPISLPTRCWPGAPGSTFCRSRSRSRVRNATRRALEFLAEAQQASGTWIPLWFGNQFAVSDRNPVYGTARVLIALGAKLPERAEPAIIRRALDWLVACQNPDGGWGGAAGIASSIEETALALHACTAHDGLVGEAVIQRGAESLNEVHRARDPHAAFSDRILLRQPVVFRRTLSTHLRDSRAPAASVIT